MGHILRLASRHARACLIAGLLAGLLLPALAASLANWLPQLVALLLVLTALRIGHRAAMGAVRDLSWGLASVLFLQTALPLVLLGGFALAGQEESPAALAVTLAAAAPALTGSVNLALLMRLDAGRMMQLMVLGTATFPLTVLPVLAALPQLGPASEIAFAALRLLAVILAATGLGFALRHVLLPRPSPRRIEALDGASVLAFSVIVVGLMAALNPALRSDPWAVAGWTVLAFALSYLLQGASLLALRRGPLQAVAGPLALGAGNRNIALFLVALPPEVLAPLMIFIGCWQLPMYLTPVLLPRLYERMLRND